MLTLRTLVNTERLKQHTHVNNDFQAAHADVKSDILTPRTHVNSKHAEALYACQN